MLRHTLQQSERSTDTGKKKKSGFVSCSGGVTYGAEEAAGNRKQEVILWSDGLYYQPDDRDFDQAMKRESRPDSGKVG